MNRRKTNLGRRTVNTISCLLGTVLLGAIGCSGEPPTPPDEMGGSGGAGMMSSSSSTGSSGMAGAGGFGGLGGPPCTEASDCPGADTECRTRTCLKNHCQLVSALAGTPVKKQSIGDCKQRVCDKTGNVVEKLDGSDLLNDQNDCTQDTCNAGQAQNTPFSMGTTCSSKGGNVCDGQGACVECNMDSDCMSSVCMQQKCILDSCVDGMKNGKETSIDCGGDDCIACTSGESCNIAGDCTSGVCDQGKCTEGNCSDGVKNGGETDVDCGGTCNACSDGKTCNIGLDCASTICTMNICHPPSCGDGFLIASETCDDGNLDDGDGCSATCTIEPDYRCSGVPSVCVPKPPTQQETETNNLCSLANGPFVPPFIYTGTISAANDVEYVAFTLTEYADVQVEPRDASTGICSPLQPSILLLGGTDCATQLAPDIMSPFVFCPGIVPSMQEPGARHLAPGTYYVHVSTPFLFEPLNYEVEVSLVARCGNGIKEGSEQCDEGGPAPGCSSECKRLPVCGDGIVDAPETCEDGNTLDGDCCSSMCQFEPGVVCPPIDIESNSTCATANGPFVLPLVVDMPFEYEGSIDPAGDVDHIAITVPNYADIQISTFAPNIAQCVAADTVIELRDSSCNTLLVSDDDDGLGNCSRITATLDNGANHIAPGTYDVTVKHYNQGIIPNYKLAVSFTALCGNGIREGSEVCDGEAGCNADCTAPLVCGDGLLHPSEPCDDQNTMSGDGCSATCTLEPGYQCSSGAPTMCNPSETNCSDGLDNDNDGQTDNNDADCKIPTYFPFCLANQTLHVFNSFPALGLAIPEYTSMGISHSLAVPNIGTISRAALLLNLTHTADTDIDLSLTPPGATMPLDVCSDNGGFSANFTNTVFDSTCSTSVTAGSGPFKGCYQPETTFSSLMGTNAQGLWTIVAVDDDAYDLGTLESWAMVFCTMP